MAKDILFFRMLMLASVTLSLVAGDKCNRCLEPSADTEEQYAHDDVNAFPFTRIINKFYFRFLK